MSRIPPREAHSPEEEDGSSPSPNKTASPLSVSLERLPADFSFSRYLSQQALTIASRPFCITLNNAPLADAHLILLALNEECRILRRGSFYHVPLRSNMTKGHPCDLVFVDERWGDKGNARWDGSDWKQRLDMCDASEFPSGCFRRPGSLLTGLDFLARKMRHSETVLALRTRILKVDLPAPFQGMSVSVVSFWLWDSQC